MIFNILDNTTELYMTKYIIDEIFSSDGATLYKKTSDQTVLASTYVESHIGRHSVCTIYEFLKRCTR